MSITNSISGLGRPVAFYPTISRAFQSNDTALIVCQFLYWRSRVGSRWIFKTQEDIEQETCVPAHTQRRIFKRLSSMGFVEIKKKGVPAKNHYFWNWEAVDKFVSDYILSLQQSVSTSGDNLLGLEVTNSKHKTKQNVTTITETTTENTTETTTDITYSDESLSARVVEPVAVTGKSVATTSPKKPKNKITANDLILEFGVSEQIANEYLVVRGKAPLTPTALKLIVNEADKIGWSLQQALTACCENSWRGFRADWIKNQQLRHGSQNNEGFKTAQASIDRLNDTSWAK